MTKDHYAEKEDGIRYQQSLQTLAITAASACILFRINLNSRHEIK